MLCKYTRLCFTRRTQAIKTWWNSFWCREPILMLCKYTRLCFTRRTQAIKTWWNSFWCREPILMLCMYSALFLPWPIFRELLVVHLVFTCTVSKTFSKVCVQTITNTMIMKYNIHVWPILRVWPLDGCPMILSLSICQWDCWFIKKCVHRP